MDYLKSPGGEYKFDASQIAKNVSEVHRRAINDRTGMHAIGQSIGVIPHFLLTLFCHEVSYFPYFDSCGDCVGVVN